MLFNVIFLIINISLIMSRLIESCRPIIYRLADISTEIARRQRAYYPITSDILVERDLLCRKLETMRNPVIVGVTDQIKHKVV